MPELFPEIEVRADHAEAIARGLIAVAKADGEIHAREAALISDFYSSVTERPIDMAALEREAAVDGSYLAAVLPSKDLRERRKLQLCRIEAPVGVRQCPGHSRPRAPGDPGQRVHARQLEPRHEHRRRRRGRQKARRDPVIHQPVSLRPPSGTTLTVTSTVGGTGILAIPPTCTT